MKCFERPALLGRDVQTRESSTSSSALRREPPKTRALELRARPEQDCAGTELVLSGEVPSVRLLLLLFFCVSTVRTTSLSLPMLISSCHVHVQLQTALQAPGASECVPSLSSAVCIAQVWFRVLEQ